ncbi:ATPase [Candidatus Parcubacteria bacterium]|nr:ATPase [Candidatus Parcubacteria bacterium]
MVPVYLDLHIHTSENPNSLNENYDLDTLIEKVKVVAQGSDFLISFTDHNTINEKVYLEAVEKIRHSLILGVELHIQTHKDTETEAYHCHIYFNLDEINKGVLNDINSKLDKLYQNKQPDLKDETIPMIEQILDEFDEYDFILLPHGGQTHSTFERSIPKGKEFDNTMQRNVYYNFFDGFTSRSDKKTEDTKAYLKKLGIDEFINLITCTDNYNPEIYPKPKADETYEFIPTWMLATPVFSGLRLSLSESSRLIYSQTQPEKWKESIKGVTLNNKYIDIDIKLTPGLNVIIGESSSGKTLLADSLNRKITRSNFKDSNYLEYGVEDMKVDYPKQMHPHFIKQNFIINATSDSNKNVKITDIAIIKNVFPIDKDAEKKINNGLAKLNTDLTDLMNSVERIDALEKEIKKMPAISSLLVTEDTDRNLITPLLPEESTLTTITYGKSEMEEHLDKINEISKKISQNPFVDHNKKLIEELIKTIKDMQEYSAFEEKVRMVIENKKKEVDTELRDQMGESEKNRQEFKELIGKMKEYYNNLYKFEKALEKISLYSIDPKPKEIKVAGHTLYIKNKLELNKEILIKKFNKFLLKDNEIEFFSELVPEKLFEAGFKQNPKVNDYTGFKNRVYLEFQEENKVIYKIETPDGEDIDNLSPGRQTSAILEIILNYEKDSAPLIIDQPEDNLATSYMNNGLVSAIKKMKTKKQIIFVSHNATIPMAGDAQNIILCENKEGKIKIRSNPLEGKIDEISVVDYIARIADGGKSSIKKRFKKYNLKKFKE